VPMLAAVAAAEVLTSLPGGWAAPQHGSRLAGRPPSRPPPPSMPSLTTAVFEAPDVDGGVAGSSPRQAVPRRAGRGGVWGTLSAPDSASDSC
jgi:hypothetical protein